MPADPRFDMRCDKCGMPLAEGNLLTVPGGLSCETHFEELSREPICDFCSERLSDDDLSWMYSAAPILLNVGDPGHEYSIQYESQGDWAACDACHVLVLGDEPTALVDRVLALRGFPPLWDGSQPSEQQKRDAKEVLLTYFTVILGAMIRPPIKKELSR